MKKILIVQILFIFSTTYSQVKTPALSTKSKISQIVGLTDIEVEYSRPAVKSRKIFGGVVPYNKIWRTGANKNTTISFSKDVSFSGIIVKKGKYSIYTIPNESEWRLMLYNETENSGLPSDWNKNKIILEHIEKYSFDGDFIESQAFGYLAIRSLLNLPISFPKTTGCNSPITGGKLVNNF